MKTIHEADLKKVIDQAAKMLSGKWVLLGGNLLPFHGAEYRTTTDIDLVGISNPTQSDQLKLFQIAEDLGLPIETINQAAGYFLTKIENFQDHLIVAKKNGDFTLLVPDFYLFIRLKCGRLSETDMHDCEKWIELNKPTTSAELIFKTKTFLELELEQALKKPNDSERAAKLTSIIGLL